MRGEKESKDEGRGRREREGKYIKTQANQWNSRNSGRRTVEKGGEGGKES